MGVPEFRPPSRGDCERIGGVATRAAGVPCRGGDWPIELESAAARADTPGPWALVPLPGNWDKSSRFSARGAASGRGEPPLGGVAPSSCDGMGEARRAVKSARGTEAEIDRGRKLEGEADLGGCSDGILEGEAIFQSD